MAQNNATELSAEEIAQLKLVEDDADALQKLVDELGCSSRRKRQFAARVMALLAEREPQLLSDCVDDLIDGLDCSEAQTRWEILDALSLLVDAHGDKIERAYEGAETALFDELSSTLRYSAFRLLCVWGATEPARSAKVWPLVDEAIQCYHGDLEYRDMLGCLYEFAQGDIDADVASELAARMKFDAENGKGSYLKARSSEIYEMLVKRFEINADKKGSRATVAKKADAESEE